MSFGDGGYCSFDIFLEFSVCYREAGAVDALDELNCAHLSHFR